MSKTDKVANKWRQDRAKEAQAKVDAILAEKDRVFDPYIVHGYRDLLRDLEGDLKVLRKAVDQMDELRYSSFSEEDAGGWRVRALILLERIRDEFRDLEHSARKGLDYTAIKRHEVYDISVMRNSARIDGSHEVVQELINEIKGLRVDQDALRLEVEGKIRYVKEDA